MNVSNNTAYLSSEPNTTFATNDARVLFVIKPSNNTTDQLPYSHTSLVRYTGLLSLYVACQSVHAYVEVRKRKMRIL